MSESSITRTVSGACVRELVRALRPFREADDVARLEHVLAVRVPQRRPAAEDDRPLLAAVLVVVRADALPLVQLVDGGTHRRGADLRAEPAVPDPVALGVVVAVGDLELVQVDLLHGASIANLSGGRSSGRRAGTTARWSCRSVRQRPIVGAFTSRRRRATTRAAAVSSSSAARSIVTPPTPGYCSANQRRMLAVRPACSASSSVESRSRAGSSRKVSSDRWAVSPATARARVESSSALSSSTGALISFQVSSIERRRLRSASRRWIAASRPRIGLSDSTASQPSWAQARVATRCQAASAASSRRGSSTPRSASRGRIRASSTMR